MITDGDSYLGLDHEQPRRLKLEIGDGTKSTHAIVT
jgi:hypothetical protein